MAKGDCFLGPPEGKDAKRHLKIILTDADKSFNQVVVTVTTLSQPEKQEMSCILRSGDHPFIKHDSVAEFKFTTVKSSVAIFNGLSKGELIRLPPLNPDVFDRVLKAAKASWRMPRRIKSRLFYGE